MAVGDRVMSYYGTQLFTTFAPAGPLLGTIIVETVGPPVLADVLWDNGLRVDALVRDQVLMKVFQADDTDLTLFAQIAKWVQLTDWPAAGVIPTAPPKSPAASGVVHNAFGWATTFDALDPISASVVMSWYDGRMRAWIPAPSDRISPAQSLLNRCITANDGRRSIRQ